MTIHIEKETETALDFDSGPVIRKVVLAALDHENCPYEVELNVILTTDEEIAAINREYRGVSGPTDVLSFPMIEFREPGNFDMLEECSAADYFNPETGELVLGDIVISVDRVIAQAESFGHSQARELGFLTAHSMLHLFGYDHETPDEAAVMESGQEEILGGLGLKRP